MEVGKVTSDGQIGELMSVDGEELYIWFYASWITIMTHQTFGHGYLIQNYLQWIDNDETGTYAGFTCNTVYENSDGYNSSPAVNNYKGSHSLRSADGGDKERWSEVGILSPDRWFITDNLTPEQTYARTYLQGRQSTQSCGGAAAIYHTVGGIAPSPESNRVNEEYWQIKNANTPI